jgi:hypothetical protein
VNVVWWLAPRNRLSSLAVMGMGTGTRLRRPGPPWETNWPVLPIGEAEAGTELSAKMLMLSPEGSRWRRGVTGGEPWRCWWLWLGRLSGRGMGGVGANGERAGGWVISGLVAAVDRLNRLLTRRMVGWRFIVGEARGGVFCFLIKSVRIAGCW